MILELFKNNTFIYVMASLCIAGIVSKLIVGVIYKILIKASDNMSSSRNKLMKLMKLKFETCYKLKIGVNNVDAFVDKYVYKYKFCGILLYTWESIGGQLLMVCLLIGTISSLLGLIYECGRIAVLSTFSMGVLTSSLLIMVDNFTNLKDKKKVLQVNIRDYLDNFLKIRLDREYLNPDLLEKYRNEYFSVEKEEIRYGEEKSKTKLEKSKKENKHMQRNSRQEGLKRFDGHKKLINNKNIEEVTSMVNVIEAEEDKRTTEDKRIKDEKRLKDEKRNREIKFAQEAKREAELYREAELRKKLDNPIKIKKDEEKMTNKDSAEIEYLLNTLIAEALSTKEENERENINIETTMGMIASTIEDVEIPDKMLEESQNQKLHKTSYDNVEERYLEYAKKKEEKIGSIEDRISELRKNNEKFEKDKKNKKAIKSKGESKKEERIINEILKEYLA